MARPREFDERKALFAAMHTFWQKGYEATSIGDLTASMNIQRPSLYAAFGGKKQLFETVLQAYVQSSLAYIEQVLHSKPTVKESLRSYFQGMIDGPGGNSPDYGCLCVNTMVELGPHDPKFAGITEQYRTGLTELFRVLIQEGIQSGELPGRLEPAATARLLTVAAIGLSVTLKTKPNQAETALIVSDILTLLE